MTTPPMTLILRDGTLGVMSGARSMTAVPLARAATRLGARGDARGARREASSRSPSLEARNTPLGLVGGGVPRAPRWRRRARPRAVPAKSTSVLCAECKKNHRRTLAVAPRAFRACNTRRLARPPSCRGLARHAPRGGARRQMASSDAASARRRRRDDGGRRDGGRAPRVSGRPSQATRERRASPARARARHETFLARRPISRPCRRRHRKRRRRRGRSGWRRSIDSRRTRDERRDRRARRPRRSRQATARAGGRAHVAEP